MVIVDNIILRNVIINRGVAKVFNHISRGEIFTLSGNVIFVLLYRTEHYIFCFLQYFLLGLPWRGEFQRENDAHSPLI